jgi:ferritin
MLLDYENDRGGHARVLALEEPTAEFTSLQAVFEQVLEHEILVSGLINNLVALSMEEKDFTTHNFLQWFVTEQIEEESLARGILDKFKLAEGDRGGLFHIDKELSGLAAAEAAEGGE